MMNDSQTSMLTGVGISLIIAGLIIALDLILERVSQQRRS